MSADDSRGGQRERLRSGNDLFNLDTFINHWPGRDEARTIFDASDAHALEVTSIGSGADPVPRADDRHLARDFLMGLDEFGYHRFVK